jgi:GDP-L-fucose synthase
MLHDGPPHSSNTSYAYAKRMLDIKCKAYRHQYNSPFLCIISTNIYGPHDNFSFEDGHVNPALIHQCWLVKQSGNPFIVRGTGKPLRQFIFSTDLAMIIMQVLEDKDNPERVVIASKEEVSIKQVAEYITTAFDYNQELLFDVTYSDGQYKKTADASLLENLVHPTWTPLQEGIINTVEWFKNNVDTIRK